MRFRRVNAQRGGRIFVLFAGLAAFGQAQAPSASLSVAAGLSWKRVAGTTIDAGLAGAASGPIAAVWYAAGTGRLLVETQSSRVFETADFIHWRLNTDAAAPIGKPTGNPTGNAGAASAATLPEAGAKVQAAGTRLYAAGPSNVYASDDNGRTWLNLTGFNNRSLIGAGFTALASAPANPQEIAAANRFGVWRSLDGGLSWRSLNEDLPNLMVRKLIDGKTAVLADGSLAEAQPGGWAPVAGGDPEIALRARFGGAIHSEAARRRFRERRHTPEPATDGCWFHTTARRRGRRYGTRRQLSPREASLEFGWMPTAPMWRWRPAGRASIAR